MTRLSLSRTVFLLITIILTAAGLILGLVTVPTLLRISDLKTNIRATQETLQAEYIKTKHLRRSLKELTTIVSTTEKFANITMRPNQEIDLITQLESIAAANNINQTLQINYTTSTASQKPGDKPAAGLKQPVYTLSVVGQGNFDDHLRYMQALETLPYYVVIHEIRFEKSRQRANEPEFVTLRFDGYVFVSEKPVSISPGADADAN